MATDDPLLHALARRIKITVNETGRCLITAPAELAPLKALGLDALRHFAASHWMDGGAASRIYPDRVFRGSSAPGGGWAHVMEATGCCSRLPLSRFRPAGVIDCRQAVGSRAGRPGDRVARRGATDELLAGEPVDLLHVGARFGPGAEFLVRCGYQACISYTAPGRGETIWGALPG